MEEDMSAVADGDDRHDDDQQGGEQNDEIDPAVQDLIRAAVDEEVAGLKETNKNLKEEKRSLTARLRVWEGLDAERVKAVMDRLELDEDARLIAEGRTDEVLVRRGERLVREQATELEEREKRIGALEEQLRTRDEQLARRVVDDQIRAAATSSGLLPTAVEDALFRGRQVFSLDEDGEAVARDAAGAVLPSMNGGTRLTPAEWLEAMREIAPHWWPKSTGANAPGAAVTNDVVLGYDQAGQLNPERYVQLRREGRIV